ncbi:aldehyde dehydrogenase family protein [Haematobacter massiliensis]|mgnify:CR=1 FL=1|uniref:aldehyde dehydrogenase family protein n=1 Tax=Haematobacter massiliensis TaxID=195105 RepID=UPI0006921879|nr:aldehyde dehydrogenase family protein [Haematobacter massiliensis]OWJ72098.1 aldehyde dehydrogenase family protein [Haematobacter massiliensis]OWJ87669.1 aldehyde dehydrogenase family protein [Haematobacter massiliensis]QBJ24106.1 aldehyde dehydrogenase family protein [Haematobacter massiliensis]
MHNTIDSEKLVTHYVDGHWIAPLSTEAFPFETPHDAAVRGSIILAGGQDVARALDAARRAFTGFSRSSKAERLALLRRIHELTQERIDDLAEAISLEMGAPIDMARRAQAGAGVGHAAGFIEALEGMDEEERLTNGDLLIRAPVGISGLITPWNWPINQISLKVLPVIATGGACVLKPSEYTPLSAIVYMEILDAAGVPAGVVNMVQGNGPGAGVALSTDPLVNHVSFTGSTRAGRAVAHAAAEDIRRITLELGGKSANLVFADCGSDLEQRVRDSVAECFLNSGQSCDAPTRMLVERDIYERVVEIAADAAANTALGLPSEPGDHIGPLVNATQFERVQDLIAAGVAEGARPVAGGPGLAPGFNAGYWVRPTVFADVTPDMRIAREEIFGPVLSILPVEGEAEAIRIANDSPYGLAAYVQTGDMERAGRVGRALDAGAIHVNGTGMGWGSPFGGWKQSGLGREGGKLGIEAFQEVKTLHLLQV